MSPKKRISRARRRLSKLVSKRRPKPARKPSRGRSPGRPDAGKGRTESTDARKLAAGAATTAKTKLVTPARGFLAAALRIWIAAAERVGALVLSAWRRLLRPALLALAALTVAIYRFLGRHVTPARGVAAVCLVALIALAASQWLDYRVVTIGADAYSGSIGAVAAAPEVDRGRAGDAHAWLMVPLALAGLVALMLALTGRRRAARLLVAIGVAAIAISLVVDAPKGLDEGDAAVVYEGAAASLLEGFWLQIATGAVLIAGGLLLPRYLRLRGAPAAARARTRAPRETRSARRPFSRGGPKRKRPPRNERGVEGAST
jgi:hypothetical protein